MKTLWNLVSFLAVVNLLALVMLAGWLWHSGRLDQSRVEQVRRILASTIAEAQAAEDAGAVELASQRVAQEQAARQADPPAKSAEQIRHISQVREQEWLARRRLDEQRDLFMKEIRAGLEQGAAQDEPAAGDASAEAVNAEAQFAKAVKNLESLPARQAKAIIVNLVGAGSRSTAVAYLNAMSSRAAAKVLSEFKAPEEVELATELLEGLRTFGAASAEAPDSANAHSNSNPLPAAASDR